tara:strand:+ start:2450 stop:3064 length:615 start_codon:yes stop_codon:yes gene_type:complete
MNAGKMVKVVKNFISNEEVKSLNQWTLKNYRNRYFINPKMDTYEKQTRFSTRQICDSGYPKFNDDIKYPKESYEIQKRLLEYLKLPNESIAPPPSFTDGISSCISFSPGYCHSHKDPIWVLDTFTLHCNFITQKPRSGGYFIANNRKYDIDVGDMLMYITSHTYHGASDVMGDIPRIIWSFGFCILKEELESIFDHQKTNFNYY